MKINKQIFGNIISKDAQKQIRGGSNICQIGQWVICKCQDGSGSTGPILTHIQSAVAWCFDNNPCGGSHGPLVSETCGG